MSINDLKLEALQKRVIEERTDASEGETIFLVNELRAVRAKVLETIHPTLLARTFVPKATDIPSDAPTYEIRVLESVGKAGHKGYKSKDHPRADVVRRVITGTVKPITAVYGWTFNDLRTAARNGIALSQLEALSARNIVERGIDETLAFGEITDNADATTSRDGLINNADVANGTGASNSRVFTGAFWDAASPDPGEMLADLNKLASACGQDTKQNFESDTILLPKTHYDLAKQTPYSDFDGKSVLAVFRENNPEIKTIAPWHRLDNVAAATSGQDLPRAIAYPKNATILEGVIPQEFEELGMQVDLYEMIFPCHARAGGVRVYYPDAVRYLDFALS